MTNHRAFDSFKDHLQRRYKPFDGLESELTKDEAEKSLAKFKSYLLKQ